MLCLSGGFAPLANFLVPTSFALPEWKRSGRICAGLINRTIRRNDLPATLRAHTPAGRAFLDIQCQRIIGAHDFEYFFNTIKIEQKIDTGGISNTSTPILKLRMNREF